MEHTHDCHNGCEHDHEIERSEEFAKVNNDKYHEAFAKYDAVGTNDEVSALVASIIDKNAKANFTPEILKKIHGFIDLTSLTSLDSKETIWKMVDSVNDFEGSRPDVPNVAAICVYPLFVETVKQALTAQDVKIAAVAGGFPASQTFSEIKVAETAMCVMEGADEIDTVINVGYFLEEDYENLCDELAEIKDSCRESTFKVILETGALATTENIRKASILALYSGADFIKTSTGKGYPGASLEAVYVMCQVVRQYNELTGKKVGIKVAGGIRTAEQAVNYYTIVKEVLGEEWLVKDLFRIGASSLVGDIEHRLGL